MTSQLQTINIGGAGVDLSPRMLVSTTIVGSPADATETAVASLTVSGALVTAFGVIVIATVSFTVGTAGVSTQLRVYHGTSAGTKIADTGALTDTAANLNSRTVIGIDTAPTLPGQVYTVTLTVASGAAVSTVSQVRLVALVV